jgi:nucleoside-diphosphate-sugar epimerase
MGVYAVTGSASGMGHNVAQKLCDAGHTVNGVDLEQADIVADLSTSEGRRAAIDRVLAASRNRLDGAVLGRC